MYIMQQFNDLMQIFSHGVLSHLPFNLIQYTWPTLWWANLMVGHMMIAHLPHTPVYKQGKPADNSTHTYASR